MSDSEEVTWTQQNTLSRPGGTAYEYVPGDEPMGSFRDAAELRALFPEDEQEAADSEPESESESEDEDDEGFSDMKVSLEKCWCMRR